MYTYKYNMVIQIYMLIKVLIKLKTIILFLTTKQPRLHLNTIH